VSWTEDYRACPAHVKPCTLGLMYDMTALRRDLLHRCPTFMMDRYLNQMPQSSWKQFLWTGFRYPMLDSLGWGDDHILTLRESPA
jgi:hypothetical protein